MPFRLLCSTDTSSLRLTPYRLMSSGSLTYSTSCFTDMGGRPIRGRAADRSPSSGCREDGVSTVPEPGRILAVSSASVSENTMSKILPEVLKPNTASGQVPPIRDANSRFMASSVRASAHLK